MDRVGGREWPTKALHPTPKVHRTIRPPVEHAELFRLDLIVQHLRTRRQEVHRRKPRIRTS